MKADMFISQGSKFLGCIKTIELTIAIWHPDFFSVGDPFSPTEEFTTFWMEDMIGLSELRLIPQTTKDSTPSQEFTPENAKMCIERLKKLFRDLAKKDPARIVPTIVLYEPSKTTSL
jgi:hypothetical protein